MRTAQVTRKTKETDIFAEINLDGGGKCEISTGIGFFDHVLTAFSKHSGIDMNVRVKGDTEIDCHHTVEDTGIVLGKAIKDALGKKAGITRFSDCFIPMDDALAFAALDISGRGFSRFDGSFMFKKCGDFDTDTTEEFFRALAINAEVTLHIRVMYGGNDHHKIEALFKAAARCFREAVAVSGTELPSTKGSL